MKFDRPSLNQLFFLDRRNEGFRIDLLPHRRSAAMALGGYIAELELDRIWFFSRAKFTAPSTQFACWLTGNGHQPQRLSL